MPPATPTSNVPASMRLRHLRDGLHARGAEAVDGHAPARCPAGPASSARDARHVHALLGLGHGAAQHHVLDSAGFEPGTRATASLMTCGGQGVRPRVLELALVGAGERGAHRAGNDDSSAMSFALTPSSFTVRSGSVALVAQRLAVLEHVLHALLGLRLAAQARGTPRARARAAAARSPARSARCRRRRAPRPASADLHVVLARSDSLSCMS